ncbi:MAG: hypothetical protein O7G30_12455 [Proteobacteria bacterium]|nr:hypothetical protein [Pseudomonadota bacterium]
MNEIPRPYVKEHCRPYPELVDAEPGPYEIHDSNELDGLPSSGLVDLKQKILCVPFDPEGRVVALHELAHVKWSPRQRSRRRARSGVGLAVEDGRINLGLERLGMPLVLGAEMHKQVLALGRQDLVRGELGHFVMRATASFGTSVEADLLALLECTPGTRSARLPTRSRERARALLGEARERLERGRRRRGEDVTSYRQGVYVARWLRRELAALGFADPQTVGLVLVGCGLGECAGKGTGEGPNRGGGGGPGRLRVTTAKLTRVCTPVAARGGRRWKPADEGTDLRFLHRYAVDQRVFRRRVHRGKGGGSVLIDASGSMSLDAADIDRIIAGAPSATLVALYSGTGDRGELRVVVREGRRAGVEALTPPGAGNIVDLPALEWLARQPAPRVWISDGGVTGCDDRSSDTVSRGCKSVCRRAGIVRVRSAEQAAMVLAGRDVGAMPTVRVRRGSGAVDAAMRRRLRSAQARLRSRESSGGSGEQLDIPF